MQKEKKAKKKSRIMLGAKISVVPPPQTILVYSITRNFLRPPLNNF